MSASDYNYNASSQTDDLCLAIIKVLGEKIADNTGSNPDAQFNYEFVASNYNNGNRSQTDDLLEEILNRIGQIGGGGGGGTADGNDKIKISANDQTAGFLLDKLGLAQSEVLFEETSDGANELLKLLAQFATRDGEKAYTGALNGGAKFNVNSETGVDVFAAFTGAGNQVMNITSDGQLVVGQGSLSPGVDHSKTIAEFADPFSGQKLRIGNDLREYAGRSTGIGIQMSRESGNNYAVGNGIFTTLDDLSVVARNFLIFHTGKDAVIDEWGARIDLRRPQQEMHYAWGGNAVTQFQSHFYVTNQNESIDLVGVNKYLANFEQHRVVENFATDLIDPNAAARMSSVAIQTDPRAKNIGALCRAAGASWNYAILVPASMGYTQLGVTADGLDAGFVEPTATLHIGNQVDPSKQFRMHHAFTPSGNLDAAGEVGSMSWDDSNFYIKTNNGWGRIPLNFAF